MANGKQDMDKDRIGKQKMFDPPTRENWTDERTHERMIATKKLLTEACLPSSENPNVSKSS